MPGKERGIGGRAYRGGAGKEGRGEDLGEVGPELGDVDGEVLGHLQDGGQAGHEGSDGQRGVRQEVRDQPAGRRAVLAAPLHHAVEEVLDEGGDGGGVVELGQAEQRLPHVTEAEELL